MEFVETSIFTRAIEEYLTDAEYAGFQEHLAEHPDEGDIIQGTGGIRKIRWAARGKGKRGGVRVVYYYRSISSHIFLLAIYAKNEVADLTPEERVFLKRLVEAWK